MELNDITESVRDIADGVELHSRRVSRTLTPVPDLIRHRGLLPICLDDVLDFLLVPKTLTTDSLVV